jgi:gamma-glutamyl phosphate reductase
MDLAATMESLGQKAKKASRLIAAANPAAKRQALLLLADLLVGRQN